LQQEHHLQRRFSFRESVIYIAFVGAGSRAECGHSPARADHTWRASGAGESSSTADFHALTEKTSRFTALRTCGLTICALAGVASLFYEFYSKRAHVKHKQAWSFFSHTDCTAFSKTANARSVCAISQKVGKKVLPFQKEVYIPGGQKSFKTLFSGVFEFFFSEKVSMLLRVRQ
jgi:hypothetical protein